MGISIKDIARALNISPSTVSRALNGSYGVKKETREQILEMAREKGYVPHLGAKELVNKRSNLIGLIIPETDFEVRPAFFETFPSLIKTLRMYGKETIMISLPPDRYEPGELPRICQARKLEGVVVLPGFLENHPVLRDVLDMKLAAVVLEESTQGRHCSNLGTDEVDGACRAVRHLIQSGHRRIGFVNGPRDLVYICKLRYEGYLKALQEAGIPFDARCVIDSDFTGRGGARSVLTLIERNPGMTAVFFANDLMAMGAIHALQEQGMRVPDQLSVMGYDGLFVGAYFTPPLTTVQIDHARIGISAAEMLMELMNGQTGRSRVVKPELVIRGSVKILPSFDN